MKLRLPRFRINFHKAFLVYFSAFLIFLTPASAVFAQQGPPLPDQQTQTSEPPPNTTSLEREPALANEENPDVAILGIGCDDVPGVNRICSGVQDAANAITDLPGTILGFFKDKILDLLELIAAGGAVFVGKLLGVDFCSVIPGFADAFGFCSSSSPSSSNFNLFTVMDIGVSGVYQAFPYHGPNNYLADEFKNNILGIGSVHAQGIGTDSLDAVRSVWQKILNFSLVIMVLVIIAISFMIMFRRKLPDRSVVSVLNALPRLAISLVLMVFSFAIGGLFIDFVYLSVNIMRNYFSDGALGGTFQFISNKLGGELIWLPVFTLFSSVPGMSLIDYHHLATLTGPGSLVLGPLAYLVAAIPELLIRLALFGAAIWLFWKLLTSFATMIGLIIFSPLIFMVGAIPGFEGAILDWFKRMAAHALVFPAVIVVLHIALGLIFLSNPIGQFFFDGHIKAPPPIGSSIVNIPYLLGVGFIFFATKLPSFFEEAFGIKPGARGGVSPGAMIFAPVNTYSTLTNPRTSPISGISSITERFANSRLGRAPVLGSLIRGAHEGVLKVGESVYQNPLDKIRAMSPSGKVVDKSITTPTAGIADTGITTPPGDEGGAPSGGSTDSGSAKSGGGDRSSGGGGDTSAASSLTEAATKLGEAASKEERAASATEAAADSTRSASNDLGKGTSGRPLSPPDAKPEISKPPGED